MTALRSRLSGLLPRFALRTSVAGLLLAGVLAGCGGSVSQVEEFAPQRLIAFGDELSVLDDSASANTSTGNARHYGINALDSTDTTNQTVSCAASSQRIWVQTLAAYYGFTFAECNPSALPSGQINAFTHAKYGARVAEVQAQVTAFEGGTQGGFSDADLVTLLVGLHDIVEVFQSDAYPTLADQKNELAARGQLLAALVNRIAGLGAHVLISLPVDVGLTPWAQAQGSDVASQLTALTDAFNTGMRTELKNDGYQIGLVALTDTIRTLHRSTLYKHTAPACDASHRNTDSYGLAGVTPSGDLLGCTTATLDTSASTSTYLWADALRPNAVQTCALPILIARSRVSQF